MLSFRVVRTVGLSLCRPSKTFGLLAAVYLFSTVHATAAADSTIVQTERASAVPFSALQSIKSRTWFTPLRPYGIVAASSGIVYVVESDTLYDPPASQIISTFRGNCFSPSCISSQRAIASNAFSSSIVQRVSDGNLYFPLSYVVQKPPQSYAPSFGIYYPSSKKFAELAYAPAGYSNTNSAAAVTSDGTIWANNVTKNGTTDLYIDGITPRNVLKRFLVSDNATVSGSASPELIVGPDQRLWETSHILAVGNTVHAILLATSTSGVTRGYVVPNRPLPGGDYLVPTFHAMVSAPDHNLWAVASENDHDTNSEVGCELFKISPTSGRVDAYQARMPSFSLGCDGPLQLDKKGYLWYPVQVQFSYPIIIVRSDLAGHQTVFDLDTAYDIGFESNSSAVDSNGNLWFLFVENCCGGVVVVPPIDPA